MSWTFLDPAERERTQQELWARYWEARKPRRERARKEQDGPTVTRPAEAPKGPHKLHLIWVNPVPPPR